MSGNRTRITILTVLTLAVGHITAAHAQMPTTAQWNAIRQSCASDYRAMCASVPTGGPRVSAVPAAKHGVLVAVMPVGRQRHLLGPQLLGRHFPGQRAAVGASELAGSGKACSGVPGRLP